ncbi:MAG: aminotransferase class V-fold PLP-dependent enzyme, partial [Gemmatimonadales bacterium]
TRVILEAIDERVRVAALPVCHWTDGALLDLPRIAKRLREAGAALAIDATQSLGVMPFDVQSVQPDFMVCATYKWLLGPYSMGFLYTAPRWQDGQPIEHNWIARKDSEDFAGLTSYRDEFQPGARRFDVGEPSNFVLLPVAIEALRQIQAWGVPSLYAAASRLAVRIVEESEPLGFHAVPSPNRAGHYVGLRRDEGLPPNLGATLAAEGVFVSVRGTALRVTPHIYNDDVDVDRFLDALRSAMG